MIGGNEELSVTLPYSQENFGVPNNLYIIGTMNTADRSIALLDTALRRRFEFIEMMPKPELLKNIYVTIGSNPAKIERYFKKDTKDKKTVKLDKILESINHKIEFLLDREHTIGHAFFLSESHLFKNEEWQDKLDEKGGESGDWFYIPLENLQVIFAKKIIPLLQEYFYEDYAKIDAVLNHNEMIKSKSMQDLGLKLSDEFVDSEKRIYTITDSKTWNEQHFQKIYDSSIKLEDKKDNEA